MKMKKRDKEKDLRTRLIMICLGSGVSLGLLFGLWQGSYPAGLFVGLLVFEIYGEWLFRDYES
jgi:asparagine N-glycosylation enzyme membrane subunit Stt3